MRIPPGAVIRLWFGVWIQAVIEQRPLLTVVCAMYWCLMLQAFGTFGLAFAVICSVMGHIAGVGIGVSLALRRNGCVVVFCNWIARKIHGPRGGI